MACRETANLWHYCGLLPRYIKREGLRGILYWLSQIKHIMHSPYFWHDTFEVYWNRLIGCRKGHKDLHYIPDVGKWYCFACEKWVESINN